MKYHNQTGNVASPNKTVAEFFAGIGLMRMGLEQADWKVLFANDICPDKEQMYTDHFQSSATDFKRGDIHELKPDMIPECTLATASFPCTDLSLAGRREGLGGKGSSAFWGFINVLDQLGPKRPPLILLENVTGFMTSHGGRDFESALLALNRLGYDVDALIINAARFVPQSRLRLFVIGTNREIWDTNELHESTAFFESDARPPCLSDFIFTHPAINWNLRSLPNLPDRKTSLVDILEDLHPESEYWWSRKRTDYLVSQMVGVHADKITKMRTRKGWSYGTVFRRVRKGRTVAEIRTDGVAGCLRTPKGGSAKQILVKAGYGEVHVRLLTPRECARLMGANDFRINVPLNHALFGFGDAVCVSAVKWIANNYLNPLLNEWAEQPKEIVYSYAETG